MTAQKVQENRVRRLAERQGLALQKSRRRDPQALDFGTFWLVNPELNAQIFPSGDGSAWGATLEELEEWLTQPVAVTQRRWTDDDVKPYLKQACIVDIDRGPLTGTLVRLSDGRYRMQNLLGSLENPAYVIYFTAAQIRRIRRL